MLFNSYEFILVYLPIMVFGFFGLCHVNHWLASMWLVAGSIFFYGWWNPVYVPLLMLSILFNYTMGYAIGNTRNQLGRRLFLVFTIVMNLALLGFFKYANFFFEQHQSETFEQLSPKSYRFLQN